MWSIAIETASSEGSVALCYQDTIRQYREFGAKGRHGQALAPTIHSLLSHYTLQPKDISHLFISLGPGSFTGIRIGIGFGLGFCQGSSTTQLVGVPTFLAIARKFQKQISTDTTLTILENARRGRVYGAVFHLSAASFDPIQPLPWLLSIEEAEERIPKEGYVVGSGTSLLPLPQERILSESWAKPRAWEIAEVGHMLLARGAEGHYEVRPLYLMVTAAEENRRKRCTL